MELIKTWCPSPKFCKYCGAELKEVTLETFNEYTGAKETTIECRNLKCRVGFRNSENGIRNF